MIFPAHKFTRRQRQPSKRALKQISERASESCRKQVRVDEVGDDDDDDDESEEN